MAVATVFSQRLTKKKTLLLLQLCFPWLLLLPLPLAPPAASSVALGASSLCFCCCLLAVRVLLFLLLLFAAVLLVLLLLASGAASMLCWRCLCCFFGFCLSLVLLSLRRACLAVTTGSLEVTLRFKLECTISLCTKGPLGVTLLFA